MSSRQERFLWPSINHQDQTAWTPFSFIITITITIINQFTLFDKFQNNFSKGSDSPFPFTSINLLSSVTQWLPLLDIWCREGTKGNILEKMLTKAHLGHRHGICQKIYTAGISGQNFQLISTVLVIKTQKNEWNQRNLHCWQKFYTAAGSDGMDKFHLWSWASLQVKSSQAKKW